MYIKRLLFFLISFVPLFQLFAQDVDYYSEQFDYEWTDASGIVQKSKLTDVATSPEQIVALLRQVYTNPDIPGTIYGYKYGDNTPAGYIDYNARKHTWLCGDDFVEQPAEGMTMLFVQIKEDWDWRNTHVTNPSQCFNYIKNCFKSVQLLTNKYRVTDEEDPGWLFSVDVTANRFFFITKGKARSDMSCGPLYSMYEQISPVPGDGSGNTENFYDEMLNGNVYNAIHDCVEVPSANNGHWFYITQSGDVEAMTNLTIFMPDRRFERTDAGMGTYGNQSYAPKTMVYTASLKATAELNNDAPHTYDVTLAWNTSLTKEKIGAQVVEQFYVYKVIDGKNYELVCIVPHEDGTTEHQYTYQEKQLTEAQTFEYVVVANPINSTITATTNHDKVTIPGYDAFFMNVATYRSHYDMNNEVNVYRNTISLQPNPEEYDGIITSGSYNLYRCSEGENVKFATITFERGDNDDYSYTIQMEAQQTDISWEFDNEPEPSPLQGKISETNPVVTIVDSFYASTAMNDHPDRYTYVLRYDSDRKSNIFPVPIYTTQSAASLCGYGFDQVENDTKHTLAENNNAQLQFNVTGDPSIMQYHAWRTADAYKIGYSAHRDASTYVTIARDDKGNLAQELGEVTLEDDNSFLVSIPDVEEYNPQAGYVPEIETYVTNGGFQKKNTYGCDIKRISRPQLSFSSSQNSKTKPFAGKYNQQMGYSCSLELVPTLPQDYDGIYFYRIWRVAPDGSETLLNEQSDISGDSWFTSYSALKGTDYDTNEVIKVKDVFISDLINQGNISIEYVARMYSYSHAFDMANTIALKAIGNKENNNYYVTEQRLFVDFNDSTPTDISKLYNNNVVSIVYYDISGNASGTPWYGVNIVKTTYSNGRIEFNKMINKESD